eukprot:gnl/TRDRNA2_/TRDRNA2_95327_c0_seq1.p1 gnl/TRDRNA2_/TRDRNA2_95327_c0~~gnl/TRDRNA2_/TRDRNA2_95327_c0_seq1.p1  ORF type:complete len:337 (-),score=55.14 gnl/TRDRNA2_/TRDRNA2_95327_c0_seq1:41-970(-)
MECLGDTASSARRRHGGTCPSFLADTLDQAALPLTNTCQTLSPREVAILYRCLRELPPSLVAPRDDRLALWSLHEALAVRAAHLAEAEALAGAELTSALYSLACLYPQLWAEREGQGPENPRWRLLRDGWRVLGATWREWRLSVSDHTSEDPRSAHQEAILKKLFEQEVEQEGEAADPGAMQNTESRGHAVANEILRILRSLGNQAHGPLPVGPLEIHAASGRQAFCLMPADAYFRRQHGAAAFVVEGPTGKELSGGPGGSGFELCHERAAEVQLLERCGWHVTPVPFFTWRRLSGDGRMRFVSEAVAS